jgi:hypothetical protein
MSPETLVESLRAETPTTSEDQNQDVFITVTRKSEHPRPNKITQTDDNTDRKKANVGGNNSQPHPLTATRTSAAVRAASAEYTKGNSRRSSLQSGLRLETIDVFAFPTPSEAVERSRPATPRATTPKASTPQQRLQPSPCGTPQEAVTQAQAMETTTLPAQGQDGEVQNT